jgi:hypothetical protein
MALSKILTGSRRYAVASATAAVLTAGLAFTSSAAASNVGWSVSVGGPGYAVSVGQPAYWGGYGYAYRPYYRARHYGPAPIVYPAAPYYVAPRPVYVAPRPVYVAPRPVYVAPPVYAAPPAVSFSFYGRGHW